MKINCAYENENERHFISQSNKSLKALASRPNVLALASKVQALALRVDLEALTLRFWAPLHDC